ncbi:MAG: TVP38/TMEM64 family protein [Geobacter sp.]|nr:TVP38/TMEM64 family protein [Geobacter sp.]
MWKTSRNIRPWLKATFFVLLLLALGVVAWSMIPAEWSDPEWIEAFLRKTGWLAPAVFILIRIVAIVVSVVPNAPLDIAGGVLFGPFEGTIYSLAGSEAGAIACFLLARFLGREAITRLLHRDITFCDQIAGKHLAYIVLFARLEPIFSFALVSYGAGLTRMSLRAFALSTLVGMTPGTVLLTYYGRSLFKSGNLWLQIAMGLLLVVMLFVIPVWIRRKNPWGLYERLKGKGGPEGKA